MVKLWSVICAVAACAVAVQGASLVERIGEPDPCPNAGADRGHLKCETSGGSPLVSDCQNAINGLTNAGCEQTNAHRSHCTTVAQYGSCKIDVCGEVHSWLNQASHVTAKQYLQALLDGCKSGAVVGGQVFPSKCHAVYKNHAELVDPTYQDSRLYRLQFSHKGS